MNDNIIQSNCLEMKQKKLDIDENKIKNLENRIAGPNSEGKLPFDYRPLKKGDIETIKSKILSNENFISREELHKKEIYENEKNKSNKSVKNNSVNNNSKKKLGSKNLLDFLKKKTNRDFEISILNSEYYSNNNILNSNTNDEIFSSKHNTSQNNLFHSNYKSTSIKDYYNVSINQNNSLILNKNISNNINELTSDNNNSNNINNNSIILNKNIKIENSIINDLNLSLLLKDKESVIESKEKIINKLKLDIKDLQSQIFSLQEYNKNLENEVKICRLDLIDKVKELELLKKEKKKKWIHEQEYNIGKIGIQRISNGHNIEYWEDGVDMISIKKKLEYIKNQKEELEKQRRKIKSNLNKLREHTNSEDLNISIENEIENKDLLNFKYTSLQKEENEVKEKKLRIEIEKANLRHEITLFNQDLLSTFSKKKEGLPLLNGRYQILSLLGKGGYSEVYKAYDVETHRYVACKLHQLNQNWKEEIKDNYIKHTIRENQIHKEINCNKIVKHYDTIEIDNDSFCTVLEFCSGPDLATYLQKNPNITEKEARIIIHQILIGLEYLNKLPKKIIHYDLKPENIIFHNLEVKISDFGLAKIIDNNKDKVQLTSQGVGTYWYLPPECFEENSKIDISSKVDIWSTGVILFEMIYKKKPFGQNFSQDKLLKDRVMINARKVEFPQKPIISEECKEFIKNCLAYRSQDRYDVFQALNSNFIKQSNKHKNKKNLDVLTNNNLLNSNNNLHIYNNNSN